MSANWVAPRRSSSSSAVLAAADCDRSHPTGNPKACRHQGVPACSAADLDVLANGQAMEESQVLERARDAHANDPMWWQGSDRPPVEHDLAGGRRVVPTENVEDRGLAGPFGPINPWIDPASTSKETPATASMPPNDRFSSRTSRSGISRSPGRSATLGQAPGAVGRGVRLARALTIEPLESIAQAGQAVRGNQHDDDDQAAIDDELICLELLE